MSVPWTPERRAKFLATRMKNLAKKKKRKYTKRFSKGPKLTLEPVDGISVSGAIVLLRKAKKGMTMEDLSEKDLYVLLALQELQGSI